MKKKLLLALPVAALSLFSITALADDSTAATTIYVSSTGSSENAGTVESPLDFASAVQRVANPGQTILLAAGTYEYDSRIIISKNGENGKLITVKPQNEGDKVVFDFSQQAFDSNNRGIQLNGDYWHFYGVEITGAGDNGMYVGGSYNIIENCQFYKNSDTGLQLGRASGSFTNIADWPSYNLIKNCTSFYNYDEETLGENADGFAAKLTVGFGNVFDGCIAYRNSDDGWDLYAKEDSGNIGTVSLYNCVSFENGFLPEARETGDGSTTYNTLNGDGIGYKLGGGVMEGDVVLENCVAFNNKLHGFSDNSNPGVIKITNCTAFNNCIGLNADGSVAQRGVEGQENKSNNFDLARDTNSYNAYYGLLSYVSNQEGFVAEGNSSYNKDAFRGSAAYSIFQTKYDTTNHKEIYYQVKDFQEATSYSDDVLPTLTEEYTTLSDDSFASLDASNAIGTKLYQIHNLYRNEDQSVNLGDLLKVVDENLLTFANGKAIGANLSKTSYAEYPHYQFSDNSQYTGDELYVHQTYDVLDVAARYEGVYQNFEIPKYLNDCEINWTSSNPAVIEIGTDEEISLSSSIYVTAKVFAQTSDTNVTITAEIVKGEATLTKEFALTVKARQSSLGDLISSDGTTTSYILNRYQTFKEPTITVTDGSSIDNSELNAELYTLTKKYEWATDKNSTYYLVDGIYTSVPGVFRVTTTATLKADESISKSFTYYIYIGKDECEVNFIPGTNYLKLNSIGFNVSGSMSNISGIIYAVVVDKQTALYEASDLLALANVQKYFFNNDVISFDFEADSSIEGGYKIYYMISDRAGKNFSELYSKEITTVNISTHEEFSNLAQGQIETDPYTIYNLQNDLDFSDHPWIVTDSPAAFSGTFNGNGYTISNITISTAIQKRANIFYKLENGTIMNVNFTNISLTNTNSSAKYIGIVGSMNGGYISEVEMNNISVIGEAASSTAAGALIGQIIGGANYITYIKLTNDENQLLRVGNKYIGGIVGNIQTESGIDNCQTYISYCIVKANIGDGKDSGGCVAGIVGRIKNDKKYYVLNVNNCYYQGTITSGGNYNAGIVGSIESGTGSYRLDSNFGDVVFVYCKGETVVLDAKEVNTEVEYQDYAHKNCNPICGRATTLTTEVLGGKNAGTWNEYFQDTINSVSYVFLYGPDYVPTASFFETFCGWDVDNIWNIAEDGTVSFR